MRNTALRGTPDLHTLCSTLNERFPPGWSAELTPGVGADREILISAPGVNPLHIAIVSRTHIAPRDVAYLVTIARKTARPTLIFASFLSPRTRETLKDAGANYADTTGNVRLALNQPAVFILTAGEDREPRPSGLLVPARQPRALLSLKGPAAGRVVRALCDFVEPYGVRRLAELAGASVATVSRVVSRLEREALLERDADHGIVRVDWAALLAEWTRDYSVTRSNRVRTFLDPRGLGPAFAARVANALGTNPSGRYAVTGSLAAMAAPWAYSTAPPWPQLAPPRLALIYTENPTAAAKALGLTETDSGSNVWLLTPYDDVVFDRTRPGFAPDGQTALVVAALSQVVADIATSPGRGPEEAATLTRWMRTSEQAWREHRDQ